MPSTTLISAITHLPANVIPLRLIRPDCTRETAPHCNGDAVSVQGATQSSRSFPLNFHPLTLFSASSRDTKQGFRVRLGSGCSKPTEILNLPVVSTVGLGPQGAVFSEEYLRDLLYVSCTSS